MAVRDIDAATAFFAEGFGFSVRFAEREMTDQIASMLGLPGASCDLVQMEHESGGPRLELIAFRHGEVGEGGPRPIAPGMAHIAFRIDSFEQALERLERLGARRVGRVTQFAAGRSVYLVTPFGAFLELEEGMAAESARSERS